MARIRTIKPEFWQNEDLSGVSLEAALLAIALLNMADDEGWFQAHPIRVKVCCFPGRDGVNVASALDELERIGYIERATGTDGKQYGKVVKFLLHQCINRPSPSHIRPLVEANDSQFNEDSLSNHGGFNEDSVSTHGGRKEGRKELRKEGRTPDLAIGADEARVHQDDSIPSEEKELPWYENPEYPNKPIQRVAKRIADTKVRSKTNPFPYRNVTEAQAKKALEHLADCPDKDAEDLFWGAWNDYHIKKTKGQYTYYDQAIGNWALKRKGEWATARRLQGGKPKGGDDELFAGIPFASSRGGAA